MKYLVNISINNNYIATIFTICLHCTEMSSSDSLFCLKQQKDLVWKNMRMSKWIYGFILGWTIPLTERASKIIRIHCKAMWCDKTINHWQAFNKMLSISDPLPEFSSDMTDTLLLPCFLRLTSQLEWTDIFHRNNPRSTMSQNARPRKRQKSFVWRVSNQQRTAAYERNWMPLSIPDSI